MPKKRLSMRRIREVLRLKHEMRRSHREIAGSLGTLTPTAFSPPRRGLRPPMSSPVPPCSKPKPSASPASARDPYPVAHTPGSRAMSLPCCELHASGRRKFRPNPNAGCRLCHLKAMSQIQCSWTLSGQTAIRSGRGMSQTKD